MTVMPFSFSTEIESRITTERLFDAKWYSRKYNLQALPAEELLLHFMGTGSRIGYAPNALFDPAFYAENFMRGVGGSITPFLHYVEIGEHSSYWPHPLVDATYVAQQLAKHGLKDSVLGALLHKCAAYSLDPHPGFSVRFYLERHPELRARRVHPVIHYIENGCAERRLPHPLFWPDWFLRSAPQGIDPRNSYALYFQDPSLFHIDPNPYFDASRYRMRHPDLAGVTINPLYHYLRFGRFENRSPNAAIDLPWMEAEYGRQMSRLHVDPLSFLLTYDNGFIRPAREGRMLDAASSEASRPASNPARLHPSDGEPVRRRILFVSHNLKVQGAQTSLFELAVGLRKGGQDVMVLAPDDGPMKGRYASEGVAVHHFRLPVAGLADEAHYRSLLAGFTALVEGLQPDIVHGNTVQSYHAIAVAARLGIPAVWNIRESESPESHGSDYHPGAKALLHEALSGKAHFAFVSAATRDLWHGAFEGLSSDVVNNGIAYDRLALPFPQSDRAFARAALGLKDGELLLLSVGTWTPRKGQHDIARALAGIDRRLWPHIRCRMIGATDTDYARGIAAEIEAVPAALRSRIDVVHETDGLADRTSVLLAYAAADLFLFTSRIESYPRVINEAMFFGLPIIATPCFGVVEQLERDVSALFYEPGDVHGLGRLIEKLAMDKGLRGRLAAAARAAAFTRVMQYDEMLKRYSALYSAISP